uniref:Uncharacterized protein n=1 Tax=Fagus sylvatica TaxID=28930 RepID=A0A2N9HNW9_FAGSY
MVAAMEESQTQMESLDLETEFLALQETERVARFFLFNGAR